MNPLSAIRSAYVAESFTRTALAPAACVAAPSGGTAAGRVGLAVPLARTPSLFLLPSSRVFASFAPSR